jgi:tripartite-type tricarboxylate transporter receptor subunit TctC
VDAPHGKSLDGCITDFWYARKIFRFNHLRISEDFLAPRGNIDFRSCSAWHHLSENDYLGPDIAPISRSGDMHRIDAQNRASRPGHIAFRFSSSDWILPMAFSPARRRAVRLAAALTLGLAAWPALAQPAAGGAGYPERPVKMVVPFAAGGATDTLARLLATKLGERLGQPVVIENKPGAGTVVAAGMVAKAPADGHTLLMTSNTTLTLNPAIRANLPYDPLKSFEPIGRIAAMSLVLVANNATPGTTLKQVMAQAAAQPGAFAYGSYGTGSTSHFGGEMLAAAAGARLLHVPYNGSAPSLTALMGHQMPVAVDTIVASGPLIKGGKIKPIALLSAKRSPAYPDIPTVAESGYPGFEMDSWFALLAPAGLPPAVRQKLEKALAEVVADPDMRKKLQDIALTPLYAPGAAVTAQVEKELPQMRALAQRADIKAE